MRRFGLALSLALCATTVAAQEQARVRAGRPNWSANGSTVTIAVTIAVTTVNPGERPLQVIQRIDLPQEWRLLTGTSAVGVEPGRAGLLMIGISVPSRAAAGPYRLPVSVFDVADERLLGSDTIVVVVPRRRSIEVGLLERPNFVVSGRSYDARFLLRNRGNAATSVRISARSSLGVVTLSENETALKADESREIRARVTTRAGLEAALDDILEIAAVERDSAPRQSEASARVTVVPEPNRSIEEYLRVPARVNVRAASSDAVSAFEAFGQGYVLDGSETRVDFLVRGPTGPFAAFGERDEYRMSLTAPSWRMRGGDQVFMLSSLTGAGQPGFGIGADITRGMFSAGAYGQQFRRMPEKGTENGAFLSMRPRADARVALNLVDRAGGMLPGQLASATATIERERFNADVELARSGGASTGLARSARLGGAVSIVTYDLGHTAADTGYAGTQRGAQHNYLIARAQPWQFVNLGLNASMHRVDLTRSVGTPYEDRLDGAAASATFFDRVMVELGRTSRGTVVQGLSAIGTQNHVRARADHDVGARSVSIEAEAGQSRDAFQVGRTFTDATLGARHGFGWGYIGGYVQRYSGGSIIKGVEPTSTVGGDASVRLSRFTQATLFGYATRQAFDNRWHSQLDALVTRNLPNGSSISLRARILGGGNLTASEQSVAYLEYGMPLRLPVSRLRTPGRVYGRIVDAVTGQGIPGALVRLGPQVAITDRGGQVAFGGVPAGEHRLSMSQETSFANAVFVDDPTLAIDSTRTSPTTFRIAVARSARVDITVRRFVAARTALGAVTDSLSDAGAVNNATLVLAGERDTLYRTTGENGRTTFTDIPPGRWTITVRGDAPAFHRFDPDRLEIDLEPGESTTLAFRLVPRRRDVQIIGEGQDLKATPAGQKAKTGGAPATKTVKPDELRPQEQKKR